MIERKIFVVVHNVFVVDVQVFIVDIHRGCDGAVCTEVTLGARGTILAVGAVRKAVAVAELVSRAFGRPREPARPVVSNHNRVHFVGQRDEDEDLPGETIRVIQRPDALGTREGTDWQHMADDSLTVFDKFPEVLGGNILDPHELFIALQGGDAVSVALGVKDCNLTLGAAVDVDYATIT